MALGITRQWIWGGIPALGFLLGHYLDLKETERMSMFRDKSALYYRKLKPGEEPSW